MNGAGPNCDQPSAEPANHSVISLIVSARVKWSLQSRSVAMFLVIRDKTRQHDIQHHCSYARRASTKQLMGPKPVRSLYA